MDECSSGEKGSRGTEKEEKPVVVLPKAIAAVVFQ
jgi:hypothetical protein